MNQLPAPKKLKQLSKLQRAIAEQFVTVGGTHAQIAKALGCSRERVTITLNLDHVKHHIRNALNDGLLRAATRGARRINRLIDKAKSEYVQLEASKYALDKAGVGTSLDQGHGLAIQVNIDLSGGPTGAQ